jgi:hypothetical protein
MNCSAFGPVDVPAPNKHWLDPFLKKMNDDNAVACSPCMNNLSAVDLGGPCSVLVPIMCLIKCEAPIMQALINVSYPAISSGSTNPIARIPRNQWKNTVLGPKTSNADAALTGEYNLTKALVGLGHNVTALVAATSNDHVDRAFSNHDALKQSIFIKNVWRAEPKSLYASSPTLYDYCIQFAKDQVGWDDNLSTNINENIMLAMRNRPFTGIIDNRNGGVQDKWLTHTEMYQKVLYAEEPIRYPISGATMSDKVAIYAHYDKDNILKDYVIQSIRLLIWLGYDIMFYTASEELKNVNNLPFIPTFVKNMGPGTDYRCWHIGLSHCEKYNKVLLVNDSVLLGINGPDAMRDSLNRIWEQNVDYWGHWDSAHEKNNIGFHYVGVPVGLTANAVPIMKAYLTARIPHCWTKHDWILRVEVPLASYMRAHGLRIASVLIESEWLDLPIHHKLTCASHNPSHIHKWIHRKEAFALKWKYALSEIPPHAIQHPYFRYITRYLLTSPAEPTHRPGWWHNSHTVFTDKLSQQYRWAGETPPV